MIDLEKLDFEWNQNYACSKPKYGGNTTENEQRIAELLRKMEELELRKSQIMTSQSKSNNINNNNSMNLYNLEDPKDKTEYMWGVIDRQYMIQNVKKKIRSTVHAEMKCNKSLLTPDFIGTLDAFKVHVPGLTDTYEFDFSNSKWIPRKPNSNNSNNNATISYYLIPNPKTSTYSNNITEVQWIQFYSCLVNNCQMNVSSGYVFARLLESHFLVIAVAQSHDLSTDSIILGFQLLNLKSQKYIYNKIRRKNPLTNINNLSIRYQPISNNVVKPILFMDLLCSSNGAGGKLMSLIEHPIFRNRIDTYRTSMPSIKFNTFMYDLIVLEAVPNIYKYYALKNKYLRSRDGLQIYPAFRLKNKDLVYQFDSYCGSLEDIEPIKDIFVEDTLVMSKYVPYDTDEMLKYQEFTKSNLLSPVSQTAQPTQTAQKQQVRQTAQTGGRHATYLVYNKRKYKVHVEKQSGQTYITSKDAKIYLRQIRGKYRYYP